MDEFQCPYTDSSQRKGTKSLQQTCVRISTGGRKMEKKMEQTGNNTFIKRIGTTVYQVNVFFDENAEKSFEEKLMHLMSTDLSLGEIGNSDNE